MLKVYGPGCGPGPSTQDGLEQFCYSVKAACLSSASRKGSESLDISDVTSYDGLLRALGAIVDLSNQERNALVLRKVDAEPDVDNAKALFDSAGESRRVKNSATLPEGGDYVVGEIRGGLFCGG